MAEKRHIELVVHYPKSKEGVHELENRVAASHARTVTDYIQNLNCPLGQKLQLHDAVANPPHKA